MTPTTDAGSPEAAARRQIHDALLSYCRGIDRLRPEIISAAFHPGAMLHDYGAEPMSIEQFAEHAPGTLKRKFAATQHRIANTTIELDSSDSDEERGATVESYVLAYHWEATADVGRLHTFNGRYIDRFAERDGRWKIVQRHLRVDWSKVESVEATMGDRWVPSGRGNDPDPLWG
ncbi:nuclear transport factor 2 family protein [Candidatus Poriferisodalis sp.]|uniref:nuclear transport factor 2 family protein n=1 Tax=Candidatus Poriferisodalis sp. TaxID=3101277 RepID=UPI003B0182FE